MNASEAIKESIKRIQNHAATVNKTAVTTIYFSEMSLTNMAIEKNIKMLVTKQNLVKRSKCAILL